MSYENLPKDLMNYIDIDTGLKRIMGNTKVYLRMLGIFVRTTEFESFRESIAVENYERAAEIAHTIKGMTGNLSFTKLFEISDALNKQLKNGTKNDELIDEFYEAKNKTQEYIALLQENLNR